MTGSSLTCIRSSSKWTPRPGTSQCTSARSALPSTTVGDPRQTPSRGGCDYGLLSRLGVEPPSALETLVLTKVRAYSLTVKVHVPGQ